jgi:EAL and modified HD-GYP domain-containing signal transduction protein
MEVFIARQPIFTKNEEVFGYELLYRNNLENQFPNINGDEATADVLINVFLNIGFEELAKGKPCFINFTEKLLQLKLPTYFKPNEVVVEILETVELSLELLEICRELKALGYRIALDDFIFNDQNIYFYALMRYVDIIKVDFRSTTPAMREKIEKMAMKAKIKLLAEKIETREEFKQANLYGYHYFQGYFFSEPIIVSTNDVPTYFYSYYQIVRALSEPEPNVETISKLIEQDLSLSYKLLKLINSPEFRLTQKIKSIRQAVVLLGFVEINKWMSVIAVRGTTGSHNEFSKEIVSISLTRAKTCELFSQLKEAVPTSAYFIVGLYSLMDTLLNMSMEKVLSTLPLDEKICDALLGKENHLRDILKLCIEVEKGNWQNTRNVCTQLGIKEEFVCSSYQKALKWSHEIMLIETEVYQAK